MRFQLIDKISSFNKKRLIIGAKGISLEADDFIPSSRRFPIYPATLCLESLAQLGGWLTVASLDFACIAVLGMIGGAQVYKEAKAGDSLLVKVKLIELSNETSMIAGEIWTDDDLIVKVKRIVYGLIKTEDKSLLKSRRKYFRPS